MNLKVSIACITYNHERYIKQALDSFLMQITSFQYEIVIGEDCSTDRTREIVSQYQRQYPEKIRFISSTANVGMSCNFVRTLGKCNGKYIAICEGDDYWIDPCKLQKQVDFLEKNPTYGLVYTDIIVVNDHNDLIQWDPLDEVRKRYCSGYTFFEQLKGATINTLTTCFRKELINELFLKREIWYIADWWLWLRISMKSKIKYLDIKSACYRRHSDNMTTNEKMNSVENNKRLFYILYDNITYFHKQRRKRLKANEREIVFRTVLRLLNSRYGKLYMKFKIVPYIFFYLPKMKYLFRLAKLKIM